MKWSDERTIRIGSWIAIVLIILVIVALEATGHPLP